MCVVVRLAPCLRFQRSFPHPKRKKPCGLTSAGFHYSLGHTYSNTAALHLPQMVSIACSCCSRGICDAVLGMCAAVVGPTS